MKPPAVPAATDYLVIESTYGDRKHPPIDPQAELAQWLRGACERSGVVVIPAFAVGRTQTLLLQIARLKQQGALADVPVFLDSPMATDVTQLYRRFQAELRVTAEECRMMCSAAHLVTSVEESKALNRRAGPMIILSASGMAAGGRVVHHIKAFAGESRNLILLSGFQAPGTRGGALAAGARSIRIHGQEIAVNAEVGQLQSASAHGDADELLDWMRQLARAPREVFITHGEPGASDTLRYRIEHELRWRATVPEYRDVVELTRA
jgi:metallo-beta-lactamase family protein